MIKNQFLKIYHYNKYPYFAAKAVLIIAGLIFFIKCFYLHIGPPVCKFSN